MKSIKILVISLLFLMVPAFAFQPSNTYAACDPTSGVGCVSSAENEVCKGINIADVSGNGCKDPAKVESLIGSVVSILSYILGTLAIIMIIIGGFKYITSGGDSNKVKSAKDTLLYALIGVVLAVSAQVLVRFVITKSNL